MHCTQQYKVAVVGGGPSGACAAEIFAQEKNIDTVMFERKMDNAKPCGGAIPLCMVGEFDIPETVVDRKVRKMNLISPSGVEVDIGDTLKPNEYIGMCRREIMDKYLRDRAIEYGAEAINGLVTSIDIPANHKTTEEPYTLNFQRNQTNLRESKRFQKQSVANLLQLVFNLVDSSIFQGGA